MAHLNELNKTLAIIPARGGSKGLPKKNIKLMNGKPMIAYSIEAARDSGIFSEIMVSTDSDEIAAIARQNGASVPYMRPGELSGDMATTAAVIRHCIEFYQNNGSDYDNICLLQPTSPLRTKVHIIEAYELFSEKNANSLVSVCECEHSPLWANTIGDDLRLDHFIREEIKNLRRQDLPQYYRLNGAIYFSKTDIFMNQSSFLGYNTIAYKMDLRSSIDIDMEEDFLFAELLMKRNNKGKGEANV